ncbi:MAG: hypothetical protein PVG12_06680 [Gammaproteobacteria bacterium]
MKNPVAVIGIGEVSSVSAHDSLNPGHPVFNIHARLAADALFAIDIATRVLANVEALLFELVVKNVYMLTTNIAGLETDGNIGELWSRHREFATEVANEIISLQEQLAGQQPGSHLLMAAWCGHSKVILNTNAWIATPARLERALERADEYAPDWPREGGCQHVVNSFRYG